MQQHTRKIGTNRGKRRIWLEGKELTDHGIRHGMRFNVFNEDKRLYIVIDPQGKRKIAGTPARPIIDMSGGTVTASFADEVEAFYIVQGSKGITLQAVED